jgi:hypothetical protein
VTSLKRRIEARLGFDVFGVTRLRSPDGRHALCFAYVWEIANGFPLFRIFLAGSDGELAGRRLAHP